MYCGSILYIDFSDGLNVDEQIVQQLGCAALKKIAHNTDNQTLIFGAGGIKDVINAMRKHKEHAALTTVSSTAATAATAILCDKRRLICARMILMSPSSCSS